MLNLKPKLKVLHGQIATTLEDPKNMDLSMLVKIVKG